MYVDEVTDSAPSNSSFQIPGDMNTHPKAMGPVIPILPAPTVVV
jgi:hypothetical protein